MGGSGDPAQTNIIAAHGPHGPDGGRTKDGRTANQFELQRKKYQFGAHGPHGPVGPKPAAGRPAAAAGGRPAGL